MKLYSLGLILWCFYSYKKIGFDKILKKAGQLFSHIYTLFIVVIGWVLFRAEDIQSTLSYLKRMFIYNSGNETTNDYIAYYYFNKELIFVGALAIIFSLPTYPYLEKKLTNKNLLPLRYVLY